MCTTHRGLKPVDVRSPCEAYPLTFRQRANQEIGGLSKGKRKHLRILIRLFLRRRSVNETLFEIVPPDVIFLEKQGPALPKQQV